jgi:hypothetical protein
MVQDFGDKVGNANPDVFAAGRNEAGKAVEWKGRGTGIGRRLAGVFRQSTLPGARIFADPAAV